MKQTISDFQNGIVFELKRLLNHYSDISIELMGVRPKCYKVKLIYRFDDVFSMQQFIRLVYKVCEIFSVRLFPSDISGCQVTFTFIFNYEYADVLYKEVAVAHIVDNLTVARW